MASASATAASSARAVPPPRATRCPSAPRRGALAGRSVGFRALRAAAAGATEPSDVARFSESPSRGGPLPEPRHPSHKLVPPPKGPGSAAAALQDARDVETLLAAASLLAELDMALDAFRALGSLAPFTDERIVFNASLIGARVAFGVETPSESVSSSYAPPKHAASVGSWACSRLFFKSGSKSDPAADSTEKELRERIVKAFREASRSTPFRVLPNLLRSEWSDFDETDDDRDETIEANVAGGWTSAADILANARTTTETPLTKDTKKNLRQSSRRERLLLSDLTVKSAVWRTAGR